MNHTYRVVYNEATNTYAAVAENVPARGKSSKSKQALAVMVAAALQMTAVSAEAAVSIGSTNGNSISSTATAGQASSVAIGKNACATNSNTIAIGDEAQAIGVNATAIANASNATGINSIAIGFNSTASAVNATALGTKANASGDGAIAFGANATAGKNITFGTLTYGNHHSIAIGTNATAEAQESVVLGHNAKALGVFKTINDTVNGVNPATVVIGNNATSRSNRGDTIVGGMASNNYNQLFRISQSTIIGSRSRVFGDQATALGSDTSAIGNSSFAIGGDDFDSAQNSIEKALDKYKTQSGYTGRLYTSLDKTITDKVNALTGNNASAVTAAIGNSNQNSDSARRQYVRTAAIGDASIAFGTMAQAGGVASIAEGTGTIARGDLSVALGPFADTYGKRSIAIGALAKTSDDKAIDAISIGTNSTVSGNSSIAIGTSNLVTGDFSGAIGDPSVIAGSNSYSIGNNNVIANNTDNAIALGGQNSVGGTIARTSLGVVSDVNASNISNVAGANRSMILGYNNTVNVDDVMVLGSNINVTTRKDSSNNNILVNGSVILGQNASTEGSHPITNVTSATVNGITYGTFAGKVSDTGRFVSVGAKGDERKIINVAAGNISATSTEAINGSQLYMVTGALSNLANTTAKGFGNNSTVNQDGTITPKINYGGNTYNNVEDALNNVSSTWKITNNNVTATEVNKTNNTVSLDNSSTITVKQNGLNFEFNANTTGLITNTTTGKVETPANGSNLVNATEVANTINNSGFTLNTTNAAGGEVSGSSDHLVKPGSKVVVDAGKNIAIKQDNGTISIATTENVSFNNVNASNVTVGPVTINKDGINAGNKPITNVSNGTNGTDAVNLSQLNATKTKVEGDKGITVTPTVSATDGSTTYKVTADTTTVTHTNGKVATPTGTDGDKLLNATEVANAINNSGFNVNAGKAGTGNVDGNQTQLVKPGDEVKFIAGDNLNLTQNGSNFTYSLNKDVNLTTNGSLTVGPVSINKDGINAGNKPITNVSNGTNGTDAVNLSQLNATKTKVEGDKGITVTPTVSATDGSTTYKVTADTTTVTHTGGKVDAPSTADSNKLLNATEVANAINNSGFNLSANGTNSSVVNPGELVDLNNTDGNIVISKKDTDNNVTFNLNNVVKVGDNSTTATTNNHPITIDGNNGTVSGLVNNLPDTYNQDAYNTGNKPNTTAKPLPSNLNVNNAATVGDVLNAGWNLQENGGVKDFVKAYDTVNFVNGAGTTANVTVNANGTVADVTYNVNADGKTTEITYVDNAGNTVYKQADGSYNTKKDGTGNTVNASDIKGSQISAIKGVDNVTSLTNGTTTTVKNTGTAEAPNYVVEVNKANVTTTPTNTADENNVTINEAGKVVAPTNSTVAGNTFVTAKDVANVINNSGFSVTSNQTTGGNVSGSTVEMINPGETITYIAGKNINITQAQNNFTFATADDVAFRTINMGGQINMGGNKIVNLAPGTNATDAATVGQLPIVRAGNNINVTTSTENGTTVYIVHTGNVTGGNGITITPTTNTTTGGSGNVPDIKVSVNTTTLTPNTNGTISAGTNASTSYATAANVANAINNSGFTLNTTASAGDVSGSSNHLVKPGSTVTADAGKNIALTQNNGTVSVATKDNVTFSNVNVGPVSINNATGINAGNLTITNVAPGVNSTDAVNIDQLKQNITNIQNQIGGNTPNATLPAKSPYITTYDAQGNVNQLNPTLSNAVINTNEQGTKYFHTNDDSLPQAANHSAYNNYDSSAYGTNSTAIGRNAEAGVRLYHANGTANNVTKELSVIKTDATGAYQTDANGMVIREAIKETRQLTSGAESIAQGHGAKAISNNSIAIGIDAQAGVVTQEVGLVDASGNPILDSNGTQEKGAVAVGGENAIAIGNKSLATGEKSISIGYGNKVTGSGSGAFGDPNIVNATNSYAIGNNNTFETDLNSTSPKYTDVFALGNSVTNVTSQSVFLGTTSGSFEQKGATIGNNGVHVADTSAGAHYTYKGENDANVAGVLDKENSKPVGIVSVGNANETRQIQGVAAGVISADSTDAINGSQLYYTNEAIGQVNNNVNQLNQAVGNLNNRINQVADDADAGTASAMATATLPQAYLPGKSMVAVGTSTYRGKQGYAVGFSAITDSGNWIIKGTASGNSKGHFGATVGAGYQW